MIVPIVIPGSASAFAQGGEWKPVRCERCGCEYVYLMVRSVTATRHFFTGAAAEVENARQDARGDLQFRLRAEADLAPCPDCGWLQSDMVEAFRFQRHPPVTALTWILAAVIAAALGVMGLMALALDNEGRPRGGPLIMTLALALIGLTCLATALAPAALIIWRRRARSRLDPNQPGDQYRSYQPHSSPVPVMRRAEYLRWARAELARTRSGYR